MNDITPYSSLTDEELLLRVYTSKHLMSALDIELAMRLEQALDALADRPQGVGDMLTRHMLNHDKDVN